MNHQEKMCKNTKIILEKCVKTPLYFSEKVAYYLYISFAWRFVNEPKRFEELKMWKNSIDRKPLVLKGARQVGKTWLMKEFGSTCYSNYVYFNFDEDEELKSLFASNKNPHRIQQVSLIQFTFDSCRYEGD